MSVEYKIDDGSGGGGGGGGVGLPGSSIGLLPPFGQNDKLALLEAAIGKPVPLAYGLHLVGGNIILLEEVTGGEHVIFIALAEGECDGIEALFVNGKLYDHTDTSRVHFHPGLDGEVGVETAPATRNQKICSLWPTKFADRFTFSRTAYLALKLAPDPAAPEAVPRVLVILRCRKVRIFNSSGTETAFQYSTNNADVYLDMQLTALVKPRAMIDEALTTADKAWFDFAQADTFRTDCDFVTPQGTKRFEAHPAFYNSTDLLRGLELLFLLSRGYHLEKAGKFAPFMNKARASSLTLGPNDIAPGSFNLGERDTRDAANKYLANFRNLDAGKGAGTISTTGTAVTGTGTKFLKFFRQGSPLRLTDGAQSGQVREVASVASDTSMTLKTAFSADQSGRAYSNPELQLSKASKMSEDETHQTEVGRILTLNLDLHNTIPERAERIVKYTKRKALDVPKQIGVRALWVPGVLDLLPGDVFTAPGKWDIYDAANNQDWDLLKLVINPDMSFELGGEKYDASLYDDTAGAQQDVTPALPGTGIPPVSGGGSYSYRTLKNVLRASDAGANATIYVEDPDTAGAFVNRVAGIGDLSITAGTITAQSFSTLVHVYYTDTGNPPTGGAKTFGTASTKEEALNGLGRFYLGSIQTPADGAPDTRGNNDSGAGAQVGGHIKRTPTTETTVGTVTGSGNAKDGNWTTKLTARTPAAGTGNITSLNTSVKLSGFGLTDDFGRVFKNLKLTVKANASVGNESDATGTSTLRVRYSTNGGSSWTDVRMATAIGAGATASLALQTDVISLPDGTDPAQVQVEVRAEGHTGGANNDGDLTSEMYEAVLEGDS